MPIRVKTEMQKDEIVTKTNSCYIRIATNGTHR